MTKKDFELIAETLQLVKAEARAWGLGNFADDVVAMFARQLGGTNPRFDRDRFLRACEPGAHVRAR